MDKLTTVVGFRRHAIRSQAYYTYERLEVADIIKGHKRAWPEVKL